MLYCTEMTLVKNINLLLCLVIYGSVAGRYSFGQQSPAGSCDVPVVVTRFMSPSRGVELVKDLGPGDFTAQLDTVSGVVASASIDDGPKRVALILDASSSIPKDEWKLETEMAAQLVRHARSRDSFYLLFVGTDNKSAALLSSSEVEEKIQQAASTRPAITVSGERVYDALSAAVSRLSPPEFGDVLFLFGHANDSDSKANQDQIMSLILKNRQRFYAISFSDPLAGKLPAGFNLNHPLPASIGPPALARMTAATGYYFSFHSIDSLNAPGQMRLFEGFLSDLYAGIAAPYRLSIPVAYSKGQIRLNISVANFKERNISERDVHFPRFIFACPLPQSATP